MLEFAIIIQHPKQSFSTTHIIRLLPNQFCTSSILSYIVWQKMLTIRAHNLPLDPCLPLLFPSLQVTLLFEILVSSNDNGFENVVIRHFINFCLIWFLFIWHLPVHNLKIRIHAFYIILHLPNLIILRPNIP